MISLKSAYNSLQTSNAPEYTTGFAASIFGVIGAASATLVSIRATQKALMLRLSSAAPGMAFGNGLIKYLGSNLFARLTGYPAIFLGLFSDASKAFRQWNNGDKLSASLTVSAGAMTAAGSFLMLEGSLAIAGPTFLIPFAGWAAAAVVIIASAVMIGGLYLHSKVNERLHSPIELWASRSIFGTRKNDGEVRKNLKLDHHRNLPPFPSLTDEIANWYNEYYSPLLLSTRTLHSLGFSKLQTGWQGELAWSYPNWTVGMPNETPAQAESVKLTILLKDFVINQSYWTATLNILKGGKQYISTPSPTAHLTQYGLLLHFASDAAGVDSISITLDYFPNAGLNEAASSRKKILLER
ncbi:hypothetical protein IAE37_005381 [Pseudomonas sp. S31]|nr:hypothetical protein [Pseudomonas sp. S31]